MFNKYLKREDLEELRRRQEQINAQQLIVSGLEIQKNIWVSRKLAECGFEEGAKANVDYKTGKITPIKDEPNAKSN